MRFRCTYWKTFVNSEGDLDCKQVTIEINALSMEDAINKDKENWNLCREPSDIEVVELDTHMASIQTFLEREMPYLAA